MSDTLKQLIGTLYFSPTRDKNGNPVSKYEGVVSGFIVRHDDGTEEVVRNEAALPTTGTLSAKDLTTLKIGMPLESLDGEKQFTVKRVYPQYGQVLVYDEDGYEYEKKFTDLRRVG